MINIKDTKWFTKKMTPGKTLKVYREKYNLTQEQLAIELKVYTQQIFWMENERFIKER